MLQQKGCTSPAGGALEHVDRNLPSAQYLPRHKGLGWEGGRAGGGGEVRNRSGPCTLKSSSASEGATGFTLGRAFVPSRRARVHAMRRRTACVRLVLRARGLDAKLIKRTRLRARAYSRRFKPAPAHTTTRTRACLHIEGDTKVDEGGRDGE